MTSLEKIRAPFSLKIFEAMITALCRVLRVRLEIIGKTNRGWLQIDVTGEDETVVLEF